MEKTFKGNANRVGTIFRNVDQNTIEMANIIFKMVYPDYILVDFADPNNEPTTPVTNNCYLVSATGTVWGIAVEKNHVLLYNGAAWEVLPYKITELSAPGYAPSEHGNEKHSSTFITGSEVPENETDPVFSASEAANFATGDKTRLDGIEDSADVTDNENVGTSINAGTSKTTPADADVFGMLDSAASWVLKKVSWTNIKATLKTYFDTLYSTVADAFSKGSDTLDDILDGTTYVKSENNYTDAEKTKLAFIAVTQNVDLDQLENDIAALANGMVYKGDWDASIGSFPGGGSAQTGWFYYVITGGTVDGVEFSAGDNIVAVVDNASATVYASNWSKHDQTDAVQAVVGLTGSVTKSALLSALNVEDGADVTDNTNVGTSINAGTSKTTPADADVFGMLDSAASWVLKKVSWTNIKATLKTYFDTLYSAASHGNEAHSSTFVTDTELDAAILEITKWYGIEYDVTNSSPEVTRIGNTALHASLPVHSKMRGCLLNDDGTVNYYLDANDWSLKEDGNASTLDGTDGQVMVEIPEYYERFETDGNIRRVKLSTLALPGFSKVPKMYVSGYEAALSRIDSKLSSVATLDTNYRGGNNNDANDANANSLLGKPATSISRTNFRSYAHNRGTNWEMYYYRAHKTLFWFFVVEYATRNSQAAVNNSLTAEGYRQGGLGNGITTANTSEWSAFNGYYPFIDCGASDSLGNSSGEVAVEITDFGGAGVNRTFNVPRYRGIENPFGHIWKNTDGINIRIYANQVVGFYNTPPASPANGMRVIVGTAPTDDFVGHENEVAQYSGSAWSFYSWGADWENWIVYSSDDDRYYLNATGAGWVETTNTNAHTSDVLTTDNPAKFNDSDFTDYILRGTLPRSNGYLQEVIFGAGGEFLPEVAGGSSSLNFCDYFYTSIPNDGYDLRTLLLGGYATNGAHAGLGNAHTSTSPSSTNAAIGSRLCYLPEHG